MTSDEVYFNESAESADVLLIHACVRNIATFYSYLTKEERLVLKDV